MMGQGFGSGAMGILILPLLVGVFLTGALVCGAVFFGIPWLLEHVSIVVK